MGRRPKAKVITTEVEKVDEVNKPTKEIEEEPNQKEIVGKPVDNDDKKDNQGETTEPIVKVKKKRGRKPKIKTAEELERLRNPIKKKRGRKPKAKYNFSNDLNEIKNKNGYLEKNDSIIVRLPIDISEFTDKTDETGSNDKSDLENNQLCKDNNFNLNNINSNNILTTGHPTAFDPYENNENLHFSVLNTSLSNNNKPNSVNEISQISNISNSLSNSLDTRKHNKDLLSQNYSLSNNNLNTSTNQCGQNCIDSSGVSANFDSNRIGSNQDNSHLSSLELKINFEKNIKNKLNNSHNCQNSKIDKLNDYLNTQHENKTKIQQLSNHKFLNNNKEWPTQSKIKCLWCCHSFENTPWGIPLKFNDNVFHMFGIFCSPNCAASYIFDTKKKDDIKWEMYSLLNLLYYKVYNTFTKISLAPSRLVLNTFGGKLTINEYRESFNKNINYKVKFPPTVSVIPIIEEENRNNININKDNFIPIDKDRILKANNEFKLQRSKPISNFKNTLENCMNITFK